MYDIMKQDELIIQISIKMVNYPGSGLSCNMGDRGENEILDSYWRFLVNLFPKPFLNFYPTANVFCFEILLNSHTWKIFFNISSLATYKNLMLSLKQSNCGINWWKELKAKGPFTFDIYYTILFYGVNRNRKCNDSVFLHAIWWNCSHGAMGVDEICNVFILESHIAITQNGYGTHSCTTSHTNMDHTQSKLHHVNTSINLHAIHSMR